MKKIIKISCMLFSIAFIITFIPVKTCAKVTNPFASQTQERPLLAPESGKKAKNAWKCAYRVL